MKKTISIIAFFAMVCMFSNGIAETGYVIVKNILDVSDSFEDSYYSGKPYGAYMKNLNEVLEKADVKDNYCLFYAKIDNQFDSYAMLAGKNEEGGSEITVWRGNDLKVHARALVYCAVMLDAWDSLEEAVGDDCPLIVALGYDEDIVCAKNSSEAQTLGEAIVYAVSLIAGQ